MAILIFSSDQLATIVIVEQINRCTEYDVVLASSVVEVDAARSNHEIEGVCVSHLDLSLWWDVEACLESSLDVPRLVFHFVALDWTLSRVDELGFDGLVWFDLTCSARDYMRLASVAIGGASSRGSRAPDPGLGVDPDPSLDAVLGYDATDLQILRLIASGLSDKELSAILILSIQTIRNRVSSILRRTGHKNRTALASDFLRSSLLTKPSLIGG